MGDDRYNRQHGRKRGHPIRDFREAHPTLLWSIVFLLIIAGLIVITMQRLVLPH